MYKYTLNTTINKNKNKTLILFQWFTNPAYMPSEIMILITCLAKINSNLKSKKNNGQYNQYLFQSRKNR